MSGSGYDAVVDVDDEVRRRDAQRKDDRPDLLSTHQPSRDCASNRYTNFLTGRPRPHRPPRRSRIPRLQLQRHDARCSQSPLVRAASPSYGILIRVLEAVPVVHLLLRTILRCRHLGCSVSMLGRALPPRQLLGCPGG